MKIGIFSDVHGYLDELKKTIDLLKSLQVDEIICAGDLVEKGLYSDAVVEFMQRVSRVVCKWNASLEFLEWKTSLKTNG